MPFMSALAITAAAVGTVGTIQQGQAAEAQGKSAQNLAEYNASVEKQKAVATRQRATFDQQRQAKRAAAEKSSLIAKLGAAGGLGSPVAGDLVGEQAEELELEGLLIGYQGEVGAKQSESQATLDSLQGSLASKRGKNLKTAAFIGAGSSLLTGFGNSYSSRG